MKLARLLPFCLVLSAGHAFADADVSAGQKCFDKYKEMEAKYDAKTADMFASDALIEITVHAPDGQTHVQKQTAAEYKADWIAALPELVKHNSHETYKNIKVVPEGANFRITGTDTSSIQQVEAPFTSLFSYDAKAGCAIHELKLDVTLPKKQ